MTTRPEALISTARHPGFDHDHLFTADDPDSPPHPDSTCWHCGLKYSYAIPDAHGRLR